jgi:hypothetical protein
MLVERAVLVGGKVTLLQYQPINQPGGPRIYVVRKIFFSAFFSAKFSRVKMFSQPVDPGYWNYVVYPPHAGGGLIMNGPPMMPRATTPADTLKAYLSMGKPPTKSPEKKPSPPVPPKRVIHSSLRPPLFVSEERKQIGPNMYAKEVTDPSVPEDDEFRFYLMCGDCDSKRLFRKNNSVIKHKQTANCLSRSEEPETIDSIITAARNTLESLSVEEVLAQCEKSAVPLVRIDKQNKAMLIDQYISYVVCGEPPTLPCTNFDSQETVQPPPVAPEVEEELDPTVLRNMYSRAREVRSRFPSIDSHMLAVAIVAGLIPTECEGVSISTQTMTQETEARKNSGRKKKSKRFVEEHVEEREEDSSDEEEEDDERKRFDVNNEVNEKQKQTKNAKRKDVEVQERRSSRLAELNQKGKKKKKQKTKFY